MPIAQALYAAGNHVISVISARNKDLLICEKEMLTCSNEFMIATDDGSKGTKGFPTQILQDLINKGKKIDIVFAVGPVPLMAAVSRLTKPYKLKTVVQLAGIAEFDGIELFITFHVERLFGSGVCVDGPEF